MANKDSITNRLAALDNQLAAMDRAAKDASHPDYQRLNAEYNQLFSQLQALEQQEQRDATDNAKKPGKKGRR